MFYFDFLARFECRAETRRERTRQIDELQSYTDRELNEIGIARSDIVARVNCEGSPDARPGSI